MDIRVVRGSWDEFSSPVIDMSHTQLHSYILGRVINQAPCKLIAAFFMLFCIANYVQAALNQLFLCLCVHVAVMLCVLYLDLCSEFEQKEKLSAWSVQ